MPNPSTITLTDRDSNDHVFNPSRDEPNDVRRFTKADANGVKIGESHLRVSRRETPSVYKVRLKLERPTVVTETINGVDNPKVVRVSMADATFTFARNSTTDERKEIIGLMADVLAPGQTMLNSVILDLENFF
jgi:hypothetical protein